MTLSNRRREAMTKKQIEELILANLPFSDEEWRAMPSFTKKMHLWGIMEWLEDMEKTTELEVTEFLVKGRKFLRGQLLGFDRHGFIIAEDYRGAFRKNAKKVPRE